MRPFIGIPSYSTHVECGTQSAATYASIANRGYTSNEVGSLLAYSFNKLWCKALNGRDTFTHFVLLHADVVPIDGKEWLNILVNEQEKAGVPVLSAVIPLKAEHGTEDYGKTSTALDLGGHTGRHPWECRTLRLNEVAQLPTTFTAEPAYDLVVPGWQYEKTLLINTGCMIIDLSQPWVEDFHFTINDTIEKRDGKFTAFVNPEDWNMSRWMAKRGVKTAATSAVNLVHIGPGLWRN